MSNSIPTPVPASSPQDFHFEYTVQKGIFMQSEEETDDEKFDFVRISLFVFLSAR
jgi:hypothetical protein